MIVFIKISKSLFYISDNIQASNEPNQNEKLYRGDKGRSYFCKDDNTVKLNGNNGDEVTIDFQEIQMQPYPLTNDTFAKRKYFLIVIRVEVNSTQSERVWCSRYG